MIFPRMLIPVLLFSAVAGAAPSGEPKMSGPELIQTFDVAGRIRSDADVDDIQGARLPDGDFFFVYSQRTSEGKTYYAVRFDPQGHARWRRKICKDCISQQVFWGQPLGGILPTPDGGVMVVGWQITKLGPDGTLQWTSPVQMKVEFSYQKSTVVHVRGGRVVVLSKTQVGADFDPDFCVLDLASGKLLNAGKLALPKLRLGYTSATVSRDGRIIALQISEDADRRSNLTAMAFSLDGKELVKKTFPELARHASFEPITQVTELRNGDFAFAGKRGFVRLDARLDLVASNQMLNYYNTYSQVIESPHGNLVVMPVSVRISPTGALVEPLRSVYPGDDVYILDVWMNAAGDRLFTLDGRARLHVAEIGPDVPCTTTPLEPLLRDARRDKDAILVPLPVSGAVALSETWSRPWAFWDCRIVSNAVFKGTEDQIVGVIQDAESDESFRRDGAHRHLFILWPGERGAEVVPLPRWLSWRGERISIVDWSIVDRGDGRLDLVAREEMKAVRLTFLDRALKAAGETRLPVSGTRTIFRPIVLLGDGSAIAALGRVEAAGVTLTRWARDGKILWERELGTVGPIKGLRFTPDNRLLVASLQRLWAVDPGDGKVL